MNRSFTDIGAVPRDWSIDPATSVNDASHDIGAVRHESVVTGQVLRPAADVTAGTWAPSAGSDLFAMLDESPADDADFIYSSTGATTDVAVVDLAAGVLPLAGVVSLVVRHRTGGPEGFDFSRWDESAWVP